MGDTLNNVYQYRNLAHIFSTFIKYRLKNPLKPPKNRLSKAFARSLSFFALFTALCNLITDPVKDASNRDVIPATGVFLCLVSQSVQFSGDTP